MCIALVTDSGMLCLLPQKSTTATASVQDSKVAEDSPTFASAHDASPSHSFGKPQYSADSRRAHLAPQSTLKNKDSAGRFGWLDAVVDSKDDDVHDEDADVPRSIVPARDELEAAPDAGAAVVKKKRRPKPAPVPSEEPQHIPPPPPEEVCKHM